MLCRFLPLSLVLLSCVTIPPPEPPGTVEGDCAAMCVRLGELGGCGMVPESQSCEAACVRQMSVRDLGGDLIVALDPKCIASVDTCEGIDACE